MSTNTSNTGQGSLLGQYATPDTTVKSAIIKQQSRLWSRKDTESLQKRSAALGALPEIVSVRYRL